MRRSAAQHASAGALFVAALATNRSAQSRGCAVRASATLSGRSRSLPYMQESRPMAFTTWAGVAPSSMSSTTPQPSPS